MTPWLDRDVVETIFRNTRGSVMGLARTKSERQRCSAALRNLEQAALQAVDCRDERIAQLEKGST